jgi:aminoglycoside phosphotransferase (APT) family kinase protein
MMAANLIVRDDRLCGVIDFGCSAIGDPACDLTLAWTTFEGSSRERFMRTVPVDRGTWARARGWALWKAVVALPTLPEDNPRNDGTRFGWRWTAVGVVDQIIKEFRAEG